MLGIVWYSITADCPKIRERWTSNVPQTCWWFQISQKCPSMIPMAFVAMAIPAGERNWKPGTAKRPDLGTSFCSRFWRTQSYTIPDLSRPRWRCIWRYLKMWDSHQERNKNMSQGASVIFKQTSWFNDGFPALLYASLTSFMVQNLHRRRPGLEVCWATGLVFQSCALTYKTKSYFIQSFGAIWSAEGVPQAHDNHLIVLKCIECLGLSIVNVWLLILKVCQKKNHHCSELKSQLRCNEWVIPQIECVRS